MSITPNNIADPNYKEPEKKPVKQPQPPRRRKASHQVESTPADNIPSGTKSIVYETSKDLKNRRLLVDSAVMQLPQSAIVDLRIRPDGAGSVSITIPATLVQVIPVGSRIVRKRAKKEQKDVR